MSGIASEFTHAPTRGDSDRTVTPAADQGPVVSLNGRFQVLKKDLVSAFGDGVLTKPDRFDKKPFRLSNAAAAMTRVVVRAQLAKPADAPNRLCPQPIIPPSLAEEVFTLADFFQIDLLKAEAIESAQPAALLEMFKFIASQVNPVELRRFEYWDKQGQTGVVRRLALGLRQEFSPLSQLSAFQTLSPAEHTTMAILLKRSVPKDCYLGGDISDEMLPVLSYIAKHDPYWGINRDQLHEAQCSHACRHLAGETLAALLQERVLSDSGMTRLFQNQWGSALREPANANKHVELLDLLWRHAKDDARTAMSGFVAAVADEELHGALAFCTGCMFPAPLLTWLWTHLSESDQLGMAEYVVISNFSPRELGEHFDPLVNGVSAAVKSQLLQRLWEWALNKSEPDSANLWAIWQHLDASQKETHLPIAKRIDVMSRLFASVEWPNVKLMKFLWETLATDTQRQQLADATNRLFCTVKRDPRFTAALVWWWPQVPQDMRHDLLALYYTGRKNGLRSAVDAIVTHPSPESVRETLVEVFSETSDHDAGQIWSSLGNAHKNMTLEPLFFAALKNGKIALLDALWQFATPEQQERLLIDPEDRALTIAMNIDRSSSYTYSDRAPRTQWVLAQLDQLPSE